MTLKNNIFSVFTSVILAKNNNTSKKYSILFKFGDETAITKTTNIL